MILEEFDLEKHIRLEKKESLAKGITLGQNLFATLTQCLLTDSRIDDLKKAAEDPKYLEQLLREYNIS